MSSYRSSAVLASVALALGAVLVPAGAYADTTDSAPAFGTAELRAALTAATVPTAAAAEAGWMAQGSDTEKGAAPAAMKVIYAVDRGSLDAEHVAHLIEAQHSGTYMTLNALRGLRTKQALKAVRRPQATWVFLPDASLDLHDASTDSGVAEMAPEHLLAQMADPARTAVIGTPTKTVAADGSTTYAFTENDLTADGERATVTMTVGPSAVLTAVTSVSADDSADIAYSYGPQHVTLPAARSTIALQLFTEGSFLAALPRQVRTGARQLAQGLTRRAHGHTVQASAIRAAARRFASSTNRLLGDRVFTVRPLPDGARITGTNRYLHRAVSYTVTATGTKAVARRA